MKRCYKFLGDKGLQKTDVLNLVFYLAMYVTCSACSSVAPKAKKIAALKVDTIADSVFGNCFTWISAEFQRLGGDDRVAKGSQLSANLKNQVIAEFGKSKKSGD